MSENAKPHALHPTLRAQLEAALQRRMRDLDRELGLHESETQVLLPEDSEEAAPIAEEIELVEKEEALEADELLLVRQALRRMKDGGYGVCTACARSIASERLLAVPWAPRCIACETDRENKLKKRR